MTTSTRESDGAQFSNQIQPGQRRTPRARREAILDYFETIEMSDDAFAAHLWVKHSTFAHWLQQRRRERAKTAPLTVHLPTGVRIDLSNSAGVSQAAELIGCLGGARGC